MSKLQQPEPNHPLTAIRRVGIVNSVVAGTPPTVNVSIGGDTTNPANLPYNASYLPTVGDQVVILSVQGDYFVLGAIGASRVASTQLGAVGGGGRITGGTSGAPQTLQSAGSLTAPAWANNARVVILLSGLYTDTATGNNFQIRLAIGPTNGPYQRVPELTTVLVRFAMMWVDTFAVTAGASTSLTVQAYRVAGTGALNCDATASYASFAVDWQP